MRETFDRGENDLDYDIIFLHIYDVIPGPNDTTVDSGKLIADAKNRIREKIRIASTAEDFERAFNAYKDAWQILGDLEAEWEEVGVSRRQRKKIRKHVLRLKEVAPNSGLTYHDRDKAMESILADGLV